MDFKHKILIVDDSKSNRLILEEILEDYYLMSVDSGEMAVAKAPQFNPDLVLLDIMMPGMDGYMVCQRFRENKIVKRAKIIMVSAKIEVADRLRAYEIGADDFIGKPFDKNELLAKVGVYLKLKTVEEVDALKSNLLNHLCRDTVNPLEHIIRPLITVLDKRSGVTGECRSLLLKSYSEAITLKQLLEKAILLGSLKSGEIQMTYSVADLVSLVQDVLQEFKLVINEKKLELHQAFPKQALVRIDVPEMKRVIHTLVDNAIRFSPPKKKIFVELSITDNDCFLSILDQGGGFDTEIDLGPSRIFSRLVEQNQEKIEWHGINLSLAQIITFLNGGDLKVDTIKGRGTNIVVVLPSEEGLENKNFDLDTAILTESKSLLADFG